jgi:hypothetical protein
MTRIEYSSMSLSSDNFSTKIQDAQSFLKKEGFEFGIQLHNSIDKEMFSCLAPLKNDIPFSIHNPVFSPYFINIASDNYQQTKELAVKCLPYLDDFSTDIFFFHGFFMTNEPIVHDMKNYRRTMRKSIGDTFCLNNSFIMNPDFYSTDIFFKYKENFSKNFAQLKKDIPDRTITLENDFVGIGSGLQRPAEIHECIDSLWFDLGHFWCASLLHGFDFHEEAFKIIETKNIAGVHINHNLSTNKMEKENIRDSHTHLYTKSEMNLAPIIRKLLEKNVDIITLEIVDANIEDLKVLFSWL